MSNSLPKSHFPPIPSRSRRPQRGGVLARSIRARHGLGPTGPPGPRPRPPPRASSPSSAAPRGRRPRPHPPPPRPPPTRFARPRPAALAAAVDPTSSSRPSSSSASGPSPTSSASCRASSAAARRASSSRATSTSSTTASPSPSPRRGGSRQLFAWPRLAASRSYGPTTTTPEICVHLSGRRTFAFRWVSNAKWVRCLGLLLDHGFGQAKHCE